MRHLFLIIALLFTAHELAAMESIPTAALAQEKTILLDVKNMTCAVCSITVKKALSSVPGVVEAKIDYASKTAIVRYDSSKTEIGALMKATANAGYPSTLKEEVK